MDKRKAIGRTVEELSDLYQRFPAAGLCFDIAHAHQVDTSMTEAYRILRAFKARIRQLHISEVTSSSKHDRISESALRSFQTVADQLPKDVPVILESPVSPFEAVSELRQASRLFEPMTRPRVAHA
jgi:endonuclease IV